MDTIQQHKRFEILEGLPGHGPMYVPISPTGEKFYWEGFVVRFYKSNGSNWIANFETGYSACSLVHDYPDVNRVVVIAKGQGYIMNPDNETPVDMFGVQINTALKTGDDRIVASDDFGITIIDKKGIWHSERISWDGIKELSINGNVLNGMSYDIGSGQDDWVPFSVNLDTKEITGGSYRRYLDMNK